MYIDPTVLVTLIVACCAFVAGSAFAGRKAPAQDVTTTPEYRAIKAQIAAHVREIERRQAERLCRSWGQEEDSPLDVWSRSTLVRGEIVNVR